MLMLPKPEEYRRKAEELETRAKRTRDLFRPHVRKLAEQVERTYRCDMRSEPRLPSPSRSTNLPNRSWNS
jgi:hypothetical protein